MQPPRKLAPTTLLLALLAAACLWLSLQYFEPIPPRRITLAAGPQGSLLYEHAEQYREALAREGVTLVVRATEGAGENLRLLGDPNSGVDLAFVQGGQAGAPEAKNVVMLASLYYQPLWIFVRRGEGVDALSALANRRVALGMPGSGARVLATPLLAASGVTADNTTIVHLPAARAHAALRDREVDAALMVGPVAAPTVRAALVDPALELASLAHADAYPQRYRYLTRRTLHAGAIGFVPLVPARDVALIATEAMLAARDDVNPAIVNLLLEVSRDVHDDQGYFEAPGEFPNVEQVDLRVSPDAVRHRRFGPSLLYRYMPFWVATWIERFIVIVVPLLAVLIPVIRLLPHVVRWRLRSRIYRWYGQLALLERDVAQHPENPPIERWLDDLQRIQRAAARMNAPASFASEVYTLREHIELVRRAVLERAAAGVAGAPGAR